MDFKKSIAKYLQIDDSNVFLYNKGRVGLYAILKALAIGENDEVILPAFTCVVVPNAILYCGAKPVYVDIDLTTYNMDVEQLEKAITPNTKIIIAQNTFGLSPDFEKIKQIAVKYNIRVIEDCTHGFGGTYNGIKNGKLCDASFFSTQWNKPFSTGIGGFVVCNDEMLSQKINEVNTQLKSPSLKDEVQLKILLLVKKYILIPLLYWPMVNTYRWLSSKNLVKGSSNAEELEGTLMPSNYFLAMGSVQQKEGIKALKKLDKLKVLRKNNFQAYNSFFAKNNLQNAMCNNTTNNIFLKFPLLVKDRDYFIAQAEINKVQLGEWFNSPLHPIKNNLEKWAYRLGECKKAEYASKHMVNLPTDVSDVNKVLLFLQNNSNELLVRPFDPQKK